MWWWPTSDNCCVLPFGVVFVSFSSASPLKPSQGAIALFTEVNRARLTFWERIKLGGHFYSGYFYFVFPYEDIGFSLTCSYHSGKNSVFCYEKSKKNVFIKKKNPFGKGRVFFPNVWKSAPCIWNIAPR